MIIIGITGDCFFEQIDERYISESSVRTKLSSFGLFASKRDAKHENPTKPVTVVEPMKAAEPVKEATQGSVVKQKTLADFSPREIIKHLYNLGYRIKGDLYQIVEKKVLLNDIIA